MGELRRILVYFVLLQISDAVAQLLLPAVAVRDGDEVSLSCFSLIADQRNCDSTSWLFSNSRSTSVEVLTKDGKIDQTARDKSDRLSVSETCSLVIKKVTDEDAGRYHCRQIGSDKRYKDTDVLLSVVTMTEQQGADGVTVTCSVSTYGPCDHAVKWLLEGQEGDEDMMTSQSSCSSTVTFKTSHAVFMSKNSELLKCKVAKGLMNEVLFPFSPPHPSGEKTTWWPYVVAAAGSAALLVVVVVVARWIKTRASKTQAGDKVPPPEARQAPMTSQPAGGDPEDGVSYASISHKTGGETTVWGGEAVTYSSVNLPFVEPSNLSATINAPKK